VAEYAFEGPVWASGTITWSFASGTPFSSAITGPYQTTVQSALAAWSESANLSFHQVAAGTPADIEIGWGSLEDGSAAGSGTIGLTTIYTTGSNQLAQATVELEDPAQRALASTAQGYTWQSTTSTLYQVSLHELGHALGLDHSTDPDAVMYPTAQTTNPGLSLADIAGMQLLYGAPAGADIGITDVTDGLSLGLLGDAYSGPVAGLQQQYSYSGPDNVNMSGGAPGLFLKGSDGNDALAVSSGRNVLDGGLGSNFLSGGTGPGSEDTFFVDGRSAATVWSTVANFHASDTATLWGYVPGVTKLAWADGQGAPGYTGATLHADMRGDGSSMASLTFAGLTSAQAQAMVVGAGTVGGIPYLQFAA
jgi:Ca2+-binding RTX toxin-like protein